jgi:zinc finger protein
MQEPEKTYIEINPDIPITEIESFCVNCEENGVTRILPTYIPFFKEIIVMAFECLNCGYRSTEVQPGQCLADQGTVFEIKVVSSKDLNRRVVKSEYANISVPECGLEIPKNTQKGKLTTIEGFLSTARDQMEGCLKDGLYAEMGEEAENKIREVVNKINDVLDLKFLPISFIIDDPAGNSFVENPFAPNTDQYCNIKYYNRTKEMCAEMGYMLEVEEKTEDNKEKIKQYHNKRNTFEVYKTNNNVSAHLIDFTKSIESNDNIMEEALRFATHCYCCYKEGDAYMCMCTIPFFKEIIICCFKCQFCGYKTTEVKGGGGVSDKATKLILKIRGPEDFNRDVFKSETCQLVIPELGFQSDTGSMGSVYTTVEGLIDKVVGNLDDTPFFHGDSSDEQSLGKIINILKGYLLQKTEFTLILDDPLSNSFIDPLHTNDDRLEKIEYERTWEQNEDLGINDMKVDNYTEDS